MTLEIQMEARIPTFDKLMIPTLNALQDLGGSGSIDEIYEKVVEQEKFPETILSPLHDVEKGTQSELAYRMAWARTYLKKYGLLENSSRGVWSLSPKARDGNNINPIEVVRTVREQTKWPEPIQQNDKEEVNLQQIEMPESSWKQKLYSLLTTKLNPAAFERLVQRMLRESGFTQVEVTGRSGDGGIDGKGIARINGLMSFHVLFQCKRYKGSVGPGEIRDFRGAMMGRTDKGLFITTGTFSPAAIREASRDGAPPIDLIDGDDLAEKLRELGLGIEKEVIEVLTINEKWFEDV